MTLGLIGKKLGMTQVYSDGAAVPVTVLQVTKHYVSQIKTVLNDGYSALQLVTGTKRHPTKPLAGHFAKANVPAGMVREFRLPNDEALAAFTLGGEITVDSLFSEGQLVDVTGTSKGKGFQGGIKRHNFRSQDASHGNSVSHRAPGSIGQNQTPGRVFKGKKMSGHMGHVQRTVQNQTLVKIDVERGLLLVKGVVPGAPGSEVVIKSAVKVRSREESK